MSDENVVSLNERRAVESEDSTKWTPLDCAKALVRDIENGTLKPARMFVIYEIEADDGSRRIDGYYANTTRDDVMRILWVKLFAYTQRCFVK